MTVSNVWRTPPEFFRTVNMEFGFQLDAAASQEDSLLPDFLSDALSEQPWPDLGNVWCNPPFNKPSPWVERCYRESKRSGNTVVLLLPLSNAPWMEFAYSHAAEIRDVYPRIQFVPPPGVKPSSNAKDNVLIIFNPQHVGQSIRKFWRWK